MMEVKSVRQLEGNRTELAITTGQKKQAYTRHFSVPTEKVDEFTAEYKKQKQRTSAIASIVSLVFAGLGGVLGGKVIKKFFIGTILGSFAFLLGGFSLAAKQAVKKDKALLDKHNVQEIFYLKENKATAK